MNMVLELLTAFICTVAISHCDSPDSSGNSANHGIFGIEAITKEEAEVGSKIINLHSSGKIVLYIRKTICKREGQLSDGVRTRFCNVVATNTH